MFNKSRRGSFEEFLVDATPSECDFNIDKKYITKEHLDELKLKWAYSSTKGSYIGFKGSVISVWEFHILDPSKYTSFVPPYSFKFHLSFNTLNSFVFSFFSTIHGVSVS